MAVFLLLLSLFVPLAASACTSSDQCCLVTTAIATYFESLGSGSPDPEAAAASGICCLTCLGNGTKIARPCALVSSWRALAACRGVCACFLPRFPQPVCAGGACVVVDAAPTDRACNPSDTNQPCRLLPKKVADTFAAKIDDPSFSVDDARATNVCFNCAGGIPYSSYTSVNAATYARWQGKANCTDELRYSCSPYRYFDLRSSCSPAGQCEAVVEATPCDKDNACVIVPSKALAYFTANLGKDSFDPLAAKASGVCCFCENSLPVSEISTVPRSVLTEWLNSTLCADADRQCACPAIYRESPAPSCGASGTCSLVDKTPRPAYRACPPGGSGANCVLLEKRIVDVFAIRMQDPSFSVDDARATDICCSCVGGPYSSYVSVSSSSFDAWLAKANCTMTCNCSPPRFWHLSPACGADGQCDAVVGPAPCSNDVDPCVAVPFAGYNYFTQNLGKDSFRSEDALATNVCCWCDSGISLSSPDVASVTRSVLTEWRNSAGCNVALLNCPACPELFRADLTPSCGSDGVCRICNGTCGPTDCGRYVFNSCEVPPTNPACSATDGCVAITPTIANYFTANYQKPTFSDVAARGTGICNPGGCGFQASDPFVGVVTSLYGSWRYAARCPPINIAAVYCDKPSPKAMCSQGKCLYVPGNDSTPAPGSSLSTDGVIALAVLLPLIVVAIVVLIVVCYCKNKNQTTDEALVEQRTPSQRPRRKSRQPSRTSGRRRRAQGYSGTPNTSV